MLDPVEAAPQHEQDAKTLVAKPARDSEPERPIRYLTLAEAFAVALEGGTIGSQSPYAPGSPNDTLVSFGGRTVPARARRDPCP